MTFVGYIDVVSSVPCIWVNKIYAKYVPDIVQSLRGIIVTRWVSAVDFLRVKNGI